MIDAIAGTTARGINSTEDKNLFDKLKTDPKEIEEHQKVCKYIENTLQCLKIKATKNLLQ